MSFDGTKILNMNKLIHEANEVVGVWEIVIEDFPYNPLKVKVVKLHHLERIDYIGIANYEIQNPKQASPYRSLHILKTPQEALQDAITGFLMYYDPCLVTQTKFVLDKEF